MQTPPNLEALVHNPSCVDDYDPNAMSVAQARQFIQQYLRPITAIQTLPLREGLGRVLAADVVSPISVPIDQNSAMDGIALRTAEAHQRLTIVGTAFAGKPFTGDIPYGCCIKIMTGAIVPDTVDTVVMQEQVKFDDHHATLLITPVVGNNIRTIGEDVRAGHTVLRAGHRIQPADLGLLASLGIGTIAVYQRLKVAFFSTGDELVSVGEPLQSGQLYDSNRYSLWGMCQQLGLDISDLGNVADDPNQLEHTLLSAAQDHDVVISSGGVSVGEADFMKALLAKHGQVLFWKINMKPGRPLAYGAIGNAHYFGLPGNPVSTMVTFYQFVQAALKTLAGERVSAMPQFDVECVSTIKKARGRTEFQRGILFEEAGVWKVKVTGGQGSGMLSSMSLANCFIVLDADVESVAAGNFVRVEPFHGVC